MKRLFIILSCLSLPLTPLWAQTKPAAPPAPAGRMAGAARPTQVAVARFTGHLSPNPAQFIIDVRTMLLATNNAGAQALGDQLRQLWGSNQLTASQQTTIAALTQKMLDKKLRPVPHLTAFFSALVGGKTKAGLTDAQVDQYLAALGQSVEHDPPAAVEKYLMTTSRVLNGGYVYRSGFNALRATGGHLSFAYKAAAAPDPNASFDAPAAPAAPPAALPPAPKAKPAAKPKPKPKPVARKKRASDGWDTPDLWSTGSKASADDGWGPPIGSAPKKKAASDGWGAPADDGWGAPVKKKAPAKTVAKAPAKPAARPVAAKPAAAATPAASASDFDQPFVPSAAAAYDAYYPPPVSGPVIELQDADLVLSTKGDSVVLHHVSGTVAPGSSRLVATGAQLDWTIKGSSVSAALSGFDFDFSKPEFAAQPVTLTYAALLEAPVKGALTYKSVRRKPGATESSYPRFISLTNDARIKDLGPGITYRGGVSIAGSQLLSAALDGSVSHLSVRQDNMLRFRAASRKFELGDSVITAGRAGIALYTSTGDSITHPGVELKYLKNKEQLKLLYEKGLYRNAPYSDSYHQVDIRAQMLVWNLREPKMEFSIITTPTQVSADFESKNFFSDTRYQQLKTINRLHPLQMLLGYSITHGHGSVLNLHDVAAATHTSEANLRSAVEGLAREGYVDINQQTGEVILLRKGRHYVGAARDKKDFDHIDIKSLTGSGRSATLDLNSNQLQLRGVKQFSFSDDSSSVTVQPDSGVVRLLRNRDLSFGGRVKTTIYGFKGRNFRFDYDGYYIDMPQIDSLTIRRRNTKKARNSTASDGVALTAKFTLTNKNKFQTGRLFLNEPTNRSGRKKLPKYPSFTSTSGAFVYFNKPDVLGGVYDSTTYFDVPPFSFDSMGTGRSTGRFIGTFHSPALPPIKTALTTQEDGSMGFKHLVPAGGYPLYGGKGHLSGGAKVELNSQGLQSNGTVSYLTAKLESDRFVMYNDSLTGEGKAGSIAASATSPQVSLPPGYLINWGARTDSLHLRTPPGGAVAKLYADHTFQGSLLVTPALVGGAGRLDGPQSYVRSEELVFQNASYTGRNALLSIKSAQAGKPALVANDVGFTYDLKQGFAEFKREDGSKADIDLPYSAFRSSLSEGRWDFKRKRVQLQAAGADSARSYFTSTMPEQLGLKFKATAATYDLAKYKLQARGVPYVAIADSWVLPDSGRIAVLPGGRFQEIQRARILMDSVTKFHQLYLGKLVLKSRLEFTGQAKYTFKYANGDSTSITFSDFRPDSSAFHPVAAARKRGLLALASKKADDAPAPNPSVSLTGGAKVAADDHFNLAPRLGYRGEVTLNSQRRGLAFEGDVRLNFSKNKAASEWVAMRDTVNPKNININLKEAKGEDGEPLLAGLYWGEDKPGLYPLYFGRPAFPTDLPIFKVDGMLHYDTKAGIYSLARQDLADANQYEGAMLTYNETDDHLTWRGPMTFTNPTKNFNLAGAGVGVAAPDSGAYRVRTLLTLEATMPGKSVETLAANLAKLTKSSPDAIGNSPDDTYNVAQIGGNPAARNFADHKMGAAPDALQKLSPKFLHTLVLNRADLRWSPQEQAWYSVGPLGVGGVGKQPFNALMNGLLEIKRVEGQDYVELYLEPSPGAFYYFRYDKNVLITQSLDEKYNYTVSSKAKYDYNTATEYGVFLGDLDEVEAFRTRFRKTYLGESAKEALARRKATAAAEEQVAQEKAAAEEAALAAIEAKKNRRKKPGEAADDAANTEAGLGEPPVETGRKSKKKKDDPFGDGVIESAPVEPVKKGKEKAPAEPAADPAAAPAKKGKAKKEKAPPAEPADEPSTEPAPDPDKKAKKEKARPTEPAADPNAEPAPDPDKKPKKKKKKGEEDPFGDS